jgi:hypothetical protein
VHTSAHRSYELWSYTLNPLAPCLFLRYVHGCEPRVLIDVRPTGIPTWVFVFAALAQSTSQW